MSSAASHVGQSWSSEIHFMNVMKNSCSRQHTVKPVLDSRALLTRTLLFSPKNKFSMYQVYETFELGIFFLLFSFLVVTTNVIKSNWFGVISDPNSMNSLSSQFCCVLTGDQLCNNWLDSRALNEYWCVKEAPAAMKTCSRPTKAINKLFLSLIYLLWLYKLKRKCISCTSNIFVCCPFFQLQNDSLQQAFSYF